MSDNNKLIAAVLCGAIGGLALGLLFAPDKGSVTRAKLRESTGGLADKFSDLLGKGLNKVKESKIGEKATEINNDLQKTMNDGKQLLS